MTIAIIAAVIVTIAAYGCWLARKIGQCAEMLRELDN